MVKTKQTHRRPEQYIHLSDDDSTQNNEVKRRRSLQIEEHLENKTAEDREMVDYVAETENPELVPPQVFAGYNSSKDCIDVSNIVSNERTRSSLENQRRNDVQPLKVGRLLDDKACNIPRSPSTSSISTLSCKSKKNKDVLTQYKIGENESSSGKSLKSTIIPLGDSENEHENKANEQDTVTEDSVTDECEESSESSTNMPSMDLMPMKDREIHWSIPPTVRMALHGAPFEVLLQISTLMTRSNSLQFMKNTFNTFEDGKNDYNIGAADLEITSSTTWNNLYSKSNSLFLPQRKELVEHPDFNGTIFCKTLKQISLSDVKTDIT
mmetsp:Transcript_8367/g.17233  ORF Transcript_8367/g.17233 Transcript_8367/m.17233 type:complete len:324 (+) Transcript_8367:61-1032(+)